MNNLNWLIGLIKICTDNIQPLNFFYKIVVAPLHFSFTEFFENITRQCIAAKYLLHQLCAPLCRILKYLLTFYVGCYKGIYLGL